MNNSKKVAGLAGLASVLWLGLVTAVAASQRRLVFNPTIKREVANPRSSGHRTRSVVLRAADGTKLSGWLMTPAVVGPRPAVVYFGGRSEEVSWVARDAGKLFPGMTVLAVNYRGYGNSQGNPDEQLMIEDGCMLFDWLGERPHVDPQRIAIVGRSLGSGVAVQVAMQRSAHSLVLITPYDSILAIAKRRFRTMPIEYVLRHRFESVKYAPSLLAPTYVLRAAFDDVVPHSHTDLLVAQLGSLHKDEIVPDSDHMNIPYLETTQSRIAAFLSAQFALPRSAPLPIVGNVLPVNAALAVGASGALGGAATHAAVPLDALLPVIATAPAMATAPTTAATEFTAIPVSTATAVETASPASASIASAAGLLPASAAAATAVVAGDAPPNPA